MSSFSSVKTRGFSSSSLGSSSTTTTMDSFQRLLNENNIRAEEKRNNSNRFFSLVALVAATSTRSSLTSDLSPRSAHSELSSETSTSEGTKYRQLPCKVFLSCGSCPYRDRCQVHIFILSPSFCVSSVNGCLTSYLHIHIFRSFAFVKYLHDPRLICRAAKTKTRKKNQDDSNTDRYVCISFY